MHILLQNHNEKIFNSIAKKNYVFYENGKENIIDLINAARDLEKSVRRIENMFNA